MKDRPHRKHLDKKKNYHKNEDNYDLFLQKKASKNLRQKKQNLYNDEDYLEDIEKYK